MKIRDAYTATLTGVSKTRRRGAAASLSGPGAVAGPGDRIDLSGRSQEVQRARSLALEAPEVREALVEEVLGEIREGRYRVTGAQVAPRLIQEHLQLRG